MQISIRLLIIVLAACPALATIHIPLVEQLVSVAAAIILICAATREQADVSGAARFISPLALSLAFPALWMIFQITPLPFPALINPIWKMTTVALGEPVAGRISISPDDTVRSLMVYLAMLSLLISTVIVTRDRHRAETLFYALSTVTTFMSAMVLISRFGGVPGLIPSTDGAASAFAAAAALSVLMNAATIIMMIGRNWGSGVAQGVSRPLLVQFALVLVGLGVSLAALANLASVGLTAAVALGFLSLILVAASRHLEVGWWPALILFAIVAAIVAAIAITRLQGIASWTIVDLAPAANTAQRSMAERMMADAPQLGNGVGTFQSLEPVYRDFEATPVLELPSAAITMAIEWGKPVLAFVVLMVAYVFIVMFRGAVRRGRDSRYASTAAAGVIVLLCEAFLDNGLLNAAVQILATITIGIGIAQSMGRTSAGN
ncbi:MULTISPECIES: hypothetical protein [Bradyrhizobium]|uniref:hypothetical protein n=1 Tax=Bradyrhizobium TaxID=374 RepID=UPI00047F4926|nr:MULTISPECIES: hypothetical protein [Bradyrhizobium]QOG22162.1 hypothetical protein FOM02_37570 [Bradyrhizobium sp. SEMIA]UFW51619.1 hypothetical protein BaraCB756_11870 [Bradyrhizobium arachidis]